MSKNVCKCGAAMGACPECGKVYKHGTVAQCTEPSCVEVNAPIDCKCGRVVSAKLDGTIDFDQSLLPWRQR